jgi:hypothetical protein
MQRSAFFDCRKARAELDLASVPLEETIGRAIAWFRGAGMA